jgi:hypothetical protein
MPQALSLPALGLVTDPGPFTAAPDGGMVDAQNVVVLRPGVMEPRPGTTRLDDTAVNTAIHLYIDNDGDKWVWDTVNEFIRKNGATTITGPTTFERGKVRVVSAGGRALFTTENGMCTLPSQPASPASGSSTVAYRAGMPQPTSPVLSASSIGAIAAGSSVAYRVTLRRRLADGTVIESAPSARSVFTDVSGAPFGVFLSGTFTTSPFQAWRTDVQATSPYGDLLAGDELCVYRSPAVVGAVPSDEMRLRVVLPYNTTYGGFVDPYNPPAPWRDGLADSSWDGASLYTNATQEGAGFANFRPQYARDVALYNGMTFYAGAKTAQRVTLTNRSLGYRQYGEQTTLETVDFGSSAAVTTGSPTITGISANDMRLLSVGQVIQTAGVSPEVAGAFPARTQVLSLTSTTATMSANSLVTNAAISLRSWDWVQVEVDSYTLRMYVTTTGAAVSSTNVTSFIMNQGYQAAEQAWSNKLDGIGDVDWERWRKVQLRVTGMDIPASGPTFGGTWVFERPNCSSAAFTVKSSKPLAWDRYVDSATGVTSAQQGGVAELQWSKKNEPEHVPLPYRTVIGDAAYAIRRIVVAKQSLLIFKDDGLFQWFGETPTNYQIMSLDRTIIIPAPSTSFTWDEQSKWVGVLGDVVYAFTTRGPMAITDAGATPVGAPVLETFRRALSSAYGAGDSNTRAMMIDTQNGRVGFTGFSGNGTYILDVATGIWTMWNHPVAMVSWAPRPSDGLVLGVSANGFTVTPRANRSSIGSVYADTYDTNTSAAAFSVSSVTGSGPYTVTFSTTVSTSVGDAVVTSGAQATISEVVSGTVVITDTSPGTGNAAILYSYECRCIWVARAEGDVASEKHWRSVVFPFELSMRLGRMRGYFSGYRNTDSAAEPFLSGTTTVSDSTVVPAYKRTFVPVTFGRDWAIKVGFTVQQAGVWFSTSGLSVLYEPIVPDKAAR